MMARLITILVFTLTCFSTVRSQIEPVPQPPNLSFKDGKARASRNFLPRKARDVQVYTVSFVKGQTISMTVVSKSIFLTDENECGVYFRLQDPARKWVFLGDSPTGIDQWEGTIASTGVHRIHIHMSCLESFRDEEHAIAKPKFHYTLEVSIKPGEGSD